MTKVITYSLIDNSGNSNNFYSDIDAFTNDAIRNANSILKTYVEDYYAYVEKNNIEILRTTNEYLLELIMTGIFWSNYIHKAEQTGYTSKMVLKRLYLLRKNNKTLKPLADKVRGNLAFYFLNKERKDTAVKYSLRSLVCLIDWLSATGEFNEEVICLRPWIEFYKTKTELQFVEILKAAIDSAVRFTANGKTALGKYTTNLSKFLANSEKQYKRREDYFLVCRNENEYFLNMFGAEIMNRQMQFEFEKTSKKALLLPTCMRTIPKNGCQAQSDGKELVCKQCNIDCNIGKIAATVDRSKITPYLIPHSSDFSRFLIKWKNNKETGLIGVACVLNLLTGGYEMKRLQIASQCVFLDYCGCKKHWDSEGFATNLNRNRLGQISVPAT